MRHLSTSLRSLGFVCLWFAAVAASAQSIRPNTSPNTRVGIGVRTPTEQLHVNGTVRIGKLPTYNEQNSYYGYWSYKTPNYTYYGNKDVLVIDDNGVVGKHRGVPQFQFYMPPILLPLCKEMCEGTNSLGQYTDQGDAQTDGNFVVNLYEHYRQQFGMTQAATQARSNASSLPDGSVLPKEKLMFFVIRYDLNYFQDVAVSDDGVLTYRVKKGVDPTEQTFMNIVFRVKN